MKYYGNPWQIKFCKSLRFIIAGFAVEITFAATTTSTSWKKYYLVENFVFPNKINNLFLPRSPPRPRPEIESKTREIGIVTLKDIQKVCF